MYTWNIFTSSFLVSANPGLEIGKVGWLGLPFALPLSGDMEQGTAHTKNFIIMPTLLSLSTYSQGGDREIGWLGPPLSSTLANAKTKTWT